MWGVVGGFEGGREGEEEAREGAESGDQDVERKFSVKVFPNEQIIMQRSHLPPPSTSPPSVPPSSPPFHCHSFSLSLFSFLSHLSLSLSLAFSLLHWLDLGSHLSQIPGLLPPSLFL